jgi:hypothetical protein
MRVKEAQCKERARFFRPGSPATRPASAASQWVGSPRPRVRPEWEQPASELGSSLLLTERSLLARAWPEPGPGRAWPELGPKSAELGPSQQQLGLRQPQQPHWALSRQCNCARRDTRVSFVAASAECQAPPERSQQKASVPLTDVKSRPVANYRESAGLKAAWSAWRRRPG